MLKGLHCILLTLFAGALAACINADPSVFTPQGTADASSDGRPSDDSGDGGDPSAACRACFDAPGTPGPGCDEYAKCKTQASCQAVFECGFERGCWSMAEQSDITSCALMCIASLGYPFEDPGVQTIIAMGPCLDVPCKPFCRNGAPWPPGGTDPNAACRSCFAAPATPGPGCAEYPECAANTNCAAIFDCGFTNGCWSKPVASDVNTCGLMCIQSLGLPFEDPGVRLLLAMQPCLFTACKPFCSEGAPWPPQ